MQQVRQVIKLTEDRKKTHKDPFAVLKQIVEKIFLGHLVIGLNAHMDLAHRNKNRKSFLKYCISHMY